MSLQSFKTYTTNLGEELLYSGEPDLTKLDELSQGPGDLWHSSYDQGFKNCLNELVYQSAVYWWFLNDFEKHESLVNWRVNVYSFVVRKSIWERFNGLDTDYENPITSGLDFGFNLMRNAGAIPMYIKNLYKAEHIEVNISPVDRYKFFFKNFKTHHSYFMLFRKGVTRFFTEYTALNKAKKSVKKKHVPYIKLRALEELKDTPSVSLVIPTMKRQKYTELLLRDFNKQTYLIKEAIIVDATPKGEREAHYYNPERFDFDIKVKWQTTKGSCRARNEAISLCTGDYIIFADDDIRVMPDYVENHLRLLQTYNAPACNGLDIMADNIHQDLTDLKRKLDAIETSRWKVGVSHMFSNANSCVRRDLVNALIGNDINFDGGYGEDSDFGLRILKHGQVLLHNPYAVNLHLKPPVGGYRFWGNQTKILGKKRKPQPWELDNPVKFIRPVPSPTISYKFLKHFNSDQIKEWRWKHFFIYLFKKDKKTLPIRLIKLPYKLLQFNRSLGYAKKLIKLGARY